MGFCYRFSIYLFYYRTENENEVSFEHSYASIFAMSVQINMD